MTAPLAEPESIVVPLSEDAVAQSRARKIATARARLMAEALILYDLGGMPAVVEGLGFAKTEVVKRFEPKGWIV